MTTTRELADFMARLDRESVPDDVLHHAKRALIDWSGVALAGAADAGSRPMMAVARRFGSGGSSPVVGRRDRLSRPMAALVNGYFGHLLDFDDTYQPARTTVHGSSPAWATVLALADRPMSGSDALLAFLAGHETQCRVGLAAGPYHYEEGWHVTGTVGHVGAAVTAGRLMGFDTDRMTAAMGTSGTQAAGLKEVYGSNGKPLHPGKAAMDAVLSAELTAEGFTSTSTILEGPRGFLAVLSEGAEPDWLSKDLGDTWAIRENSHKPYACGSLMHPTIEAILHLRDLHPIRPEEVASIEATVHSYVSWVTAKAAPATGLEGKFSIFHASAVAMLDGRGLPEQFSDTRVNAPDVLAMRDRVRIVVEDALPKEGARVVVRMQDGRAFDHYVDRNKGSSVKPLSDAELDTKFRALADPVLGEEVARRCSEVFWTLEEQDDSSRALSLLTEVAR